MNSRFKYAVVTSSSFLVALLLIGGVLGQSASPEDPYKHLAVYTEVLARIKSDYVEDPDIKSVTLGALNGLLESIDPYASYLSADQYKQYQKLKDAHKGNCGLVLSKKYGYIGVVGVIPGSPAAKAGLGTGDMLESIKGVTTRDMPLAWADILLQGEPGSSIELSVLRFRKPEPQKMTLTRAIVQPAPVAARMLPNQIGYLQVQTLENGKTAEIAGAVRDLERQGAKKLVLDLRSNAWGEPAEGIALANLFIDQGALGYVQGQKVARQNFDADPAKTVFRQPMTVIVNRGVANGAEVAAAALLEAKRGEVVGERSYGDAALRRAITMEDGGAVILSVAKYYSPSGKAIQDVGVTPSVAMVEVEPTADLDEDQQPEPQPRKSGEDLLLNKAIEVLTGTSSAESSAAGERRTPEDPSNRRIITTEKPNPK